MSYKCEYCNRYYSSNKSLYTHNHKFHLDNTKSINKKKQVKNINKNSDQVTDKPGMIEPVIIEKDADDLLMDEDDNNKELLNEPVADDLLTDEHNNKELLNEPVADYLLTDDDDNNKELLNEPVADYLLTDEHDNKELLNEPVADYLLTDDDDNNKELLNEPVADYLLTDDDDNNKELLNEPVMIEQLSDEQYTDEHDTDEPVVNEQVAGEVQKMNFYQYFFKNNIYFDTYSFLIFCTQSYLFLPFLSVLNNLKTFIIKPFCISNKKSAVLQEETDLSQEETDLSQEETVITQEDNIMCIQCNILSSICWCKLKNDQIRIRKGIDEFKNEMKINQEESTKLTEEINELNIKINKNLLFY